MKRSLLASAAVTVLCAGVAWAHAHLEMTTPRENSVLKSAPAEIVLQFSLPVRLTALSIQKKDGERQSVKPLPATAAKTIAVPISPLAAGEYAAEWRVVSGDNHMMSGTLHFQINAQ